MPREVLTMKTLIDRGFALEAYERRRWNCSTESDNFHARVHRGDVADPVDLRFEAREFDIRFEALCIGIPSKDAYWVREVHQPSVRHPSFLVKAYHCGSNNDRSTVIQPLQIQVPNLASPGH